MTRRYALREDRWEKIKNLLPGREGTVGVTAQDNRLFIDAVLFLFYDYGMIRERLNKFYKGDRLWVKN